MRNNTEAKLAWLAFLAAMVAAMLFCNGCAGIKIERDSTGAVIGVTSYGFLRTAAVKTKNKDGEELSISTESQTGDMLLGMNKLLGTATATAEKLKP